MNATVEYCSNGVTWTEAEEQQFRAERETNKRDWANFTADGTLPGYLERAEDHADAVDTYANLIAVMYSNSEERMTGVPVIHDINRDGNVTITAGEDDLRRVVIQPMGLIAMELASPEAADKFVALFNEKCGENGRYAEAIDYREVYLRSRAAGF